MKIKNSFKFNLIDFSLVLFIFVKTGVFNNNGIFANIFSSILHNSSLASSILEYSSLAIFTFATFINILRNKKFIITKHIIFYTLFVLFACLSHLWSISKKNSLESIITLVSLLTFLMALSNYVSNEKKLINLVKYVVWANILVSLKIILLYWFHSGSAAARIQSITGIYFNTVGQVIGFSIIFSLLLYRILKNKTYIYFIIPQFIAIVLTESRKSLLIPIVGFLLISLLDGKIKTVVKNLLLIGICGLILIFMLNRFNPDIYNRIKVKFDGLLSYVNGGSTTDWSINLRARFIDTGISIFKSHPIGGIGINNFSYFAGHYTSYRIERYAHNNYVELLSCVGIIGFILYYTSYIYIIINLFKRKKEKKDDFSIVALSFILVLAIMEWGVVSYSGCLYHIYILISYFIILYQSKIIDIKEDYHERKN